MKIAIREFGNSQVFRCSIKRNKYKTSNHIHQHIEIVIPLEGETDVVIKDKRTVMSPGDICVITPFQPHRIRAHKDSELWMAVFSTACVPDWHIDAERVMRSDSLIFKLEDPLLSFVKKHLLKYSDTPYVFFDDIPREIKSALYAIFTEFFQCAPKNDNIKHGNALSTMILYIGEHFRENITLSSVSKAIGYNPKYLSQCLSALPDTTFPSLINSCRIELSKTMLIRTDMNISDIAYECGYNEERTYRRVFTNSMGYSPSEYRKRYGKFHPQLSAARNTKQTNSDTSPRP